MSEGTKLGEFSGTSAFSPAVVHEPVSPESLKSTKIGEVSEFEKSLFPEPPSTQTKASPAPVSDDFSHALQQLVADYKDGDLISGTVRGIEKAGVMVDIGYKSDGFIPASEFSNDPDLIPSQVVQVGDEIRAVIQKLESKEGYTILSRKQAEYEEAWNTLGKLAKSKDVIEVRVSSKVQGGLVAAFMGIKGFIPASQVIQDASEDLGQFVGQTLEVAVMQADRKRRKVVFTKKTGRSRASKEQVNQLFDELEIGQVRSGKVSSIRDFGAFVDLGGVEGLVHISEISWARVNHPSDRLAVGDMVNVFVLGIDREAHKISLGMKQLEADPWVKVVEKYHVGQLVEGTVSRIVTFGAFVKLEENLEGLIHISELSSKRVAKVEDVLHPGQIVQTRIIKLSPSEQRIGLSIRQLQQESDTQATPENPSTETVSVETE